MNNIKKTILLINLGLMPFICVAQNPVDRDTFDLNYIIGHVSMLNSDTIQLNMKKDTVLVDCLCVDQKYGLIVEKKKKERTLQWQEVPLPSIASEYRFKYDFVPIETRWIEDVDDCYILIKAEN